MDRDFATAGKVLEAPAAAIRAPAQDPGAAPEVRFHGILHPAAHDPATLERHDAPEHFHDLNLDQIVGAVTAPRGAYDLAPFYHASVHDPDTIAYRHEVFRDIENADLSQALEQFSEGLRTTRAHISNSEERHYPHEKERWFLAGVTTYCGSLRELAASLERLRPVSRGLTAFGHYLVGYLAAPGFKRLEDGQRELTEALSAIRYAVLIDGANITVRDYHDEIDYTAAVEATFAKFRHAAAKDYRVKFARSSGMNHIQAQVVDRVAMLNPETFRAVSEYCAEHVDFVDDVIARFEREVQFYLAYLSHIAPARAAGLAFCYPRLSATSKDIDARDAFDLALARKLVDEGKEVVRNDYFLSGRERIFVVSGPNNGGKTTFARTFGQMHYLASLGCPVPGASARLFLCDRLFAHFEREEDIANLRGKLQDDLVRIHRILAQATSDSIVVMNEIFASTTLEDALYLGRKILARISGLDLLAVCVTFLDELASFDEKTVSMVSTVDPRDPAIRTYKVERKRADGLAYALAIARKYGVTYERLKERIGE